jgi:hypothetical protein
MAKISQNQAIMIGAVIIAAALILTMFGAQIQSYIVGPAPLKYTSGLKAQFSVVDTTSGAMLTSSAPTCAATVYVAGTDPTPYLFSSTTTATTARVAVASYSTTLGYWVAMLNAGTYTVLCTDNAATGSQTKYPSITTVSVLGTDSDTLVTVMSPSTLSMIERASVTIASPSVAEYNTTAASYSLSVSPWNATTYSKATVTLSFSIGGTAKQILPGNIYVTQITGLTLTSATIDGTTGAVSLDTTGALNGGTLIGYYLPYTSAWLGGATHTVVLYFQRTGTIAHSASNSLTFTLEDDAGVQNPTLVWWTYYTKTLTFST